VRASLKKEKLLLFLAKIHENWPLASKVGRLLSQPLGYSYKYKMEIIIFGFICLFLKFLILNYDCQTYYSEINKIFQQELLILTHR
jgi:hypothetical protein